MTTPPFVASTSRRILLQAAGLAAVAGFAGHARTYAQATPTADTSWLKDWSGTTLTLSSHIGPSTDAYAEIAQEFERLTGAKVTVQAEPWTDLLSKHLAEFGASTGTFDILTWPYIWMGHYVEGAMVENLDEWFASGGDLIDPDYGMDDFIPAILDVYGRYDAAGFANPETLWAVPYKFDVYLAYYRTDLLEEAGLQGAPATYDELASMAETLKEKYPDLSPVTMPLAVDDPLVATYLPILGAFGGALPNPWFDENQFPLFQEEAGLQAVETLKGLLPYMPSDVLGMDYDAVNAQVQQGLTAYAWNWNAYLPAVLDPEKSTVSDKIGFSLTPAGPNGQPQGLGGWTMGISSQSAQKEAAFQLLQFLSGKNRGPALALAGGSVARYSVAEDPAVSQAFPYYPLLLEAMGNVAVRGSDRSWAEAQRTIGVGLSEILLGEDAQAGLVDTAGEVYDQEQKAGYTPEATGPRPGS